VCGGGGTEQHHNQLRLDEVLHWEGAESRQDGRAHPTVQLRLVVRVLQREVSVTSSVRQCSWSVPRVSVTSSVRQCSWSVLKVSVTPSVRQCSWSVPRVHGLHIKQGFAMQCSGSVTSSVAVQCSGSATSSEAMDAPNQHHDLPLQPVLNCVIWSRGRSVTEVEKKRHHRTELPGHRYHSYLRLEVWQRLCSLQCCGRICSANR
jgi:hypothetical protein